MHDDFHARSIGPRLRLSILFVLSGWMILGCGETGTWSHDEQVSLDGVPASVLERFDGRWFYSRDLVMVVDASRRKLAIDLPPGARIETVRAVGNELWIMVAMATGERSEHGLRLLESDLLMSRRVDDAQCHGTFIAERLSRLAEMECRLLAFAERSAEELEKELDKLMRQL